MILAVVFLGIIEKKEVAALEGRDSEDIGNRK
jgi:hypothetical protein